MFTHSNIVQSIQMVSKDGPKGRFYTTPSGEKYPSITTILGHGDKTWLKEWRISMGFEKADKEMKRCADRGSAVHLMIEKYLQNDPTPTKGQHIDHIVEFNPMKLILKPVDNILLQEAALYSDMLKVAGRVDCIAEYKGKLAIIDFKTSNRDKTQSMIQDYFLQTTAYALMVDEMYDIVIEDIVILMSVEKGAVPLVFKGKVDDYIAPLLDRIQAYYASINQ